MQRINPDDFSPKTTTAVQAVCAWPNMHVLPDGTVMAAIFNQPCHGKWEGDLDLYASTDGGVSWNFRGRIAPHDPKTNRMNCSFGSANNGDLVSLCAGWKDREPRGGEMKPFPQSGRLTARAYRSTDQGKTWVSFGDVQSSEYDPVVPFGDIHARGGGRLVTTCYAQNKNGIYACLILHSHDDGKTWTIGPMISDCGNETSILPLEGGRWIAGVRYEKTTHIQLYESTDDAKTWRSVQAVTMPGQVTSHLARLKDGRILLSYGNRCINNYGVDVRFSDDQGHTWSAPVRVADAPLRDCGYPDTVELADGTLVTGFYTQIPGYFTYEMRVTHWKAPAR